MDINIYMWSKKLIIGLPDTFQVPGSKKTRSLSLISTKYKSNYYYLYTDQYII